ncbi:PBECR2 nuclease fold domain-containing protein [Flavobacterium sp.]|uniref:PBECR2 nuclease fold domain-containing protein n=1 Tax=Flavobacterium sp. TaxID=239 RepID=UPI00261BD8F7|nr:PBECR2 nuclease fold domain-containing protein [Flavobacterium sp.]
MNEDEWDDIYTQIARELLQNKSNNVINKDLYFKTATKLIDAINGGLETTYYDSSSSKNILSQYLKHNIYSFSAAKSLTEMLHFRNLMISENGTILNFASFKAKIANDGFAFNNSFLKTEYNTAFQSAIMAHKWNTLDSDYLEYSTVGDKRVRDEHKALDKLTLHKSSPVWKRIWTPNGFNCRCTIVPGLKQNVKLTDAEAGALGKKAVTNPLFDNNVGISRIIFNESHPYFINTSGKIQQLNYEQYGLEPLAKIQTDYNLYRWNDSTKEEYYNWWKDNSDSNENIILGDFFGNEILFSKRFKNHINDNVDEHRYKYGKELKTIIENPDEIWSSIDPKNKELNTFYLKYYEPKNNNKTGVITVFVKEDKAHSMYEIDTEKRLKEIRRGSLQYTSKK